MNDKEARKIFAKHRILVREDKSLGSYDGYLWWSPTPSIDSSGHLHTNLTPTIDASMHVDALEALTWWVRAYAERVT